jgi:uncharacterized membrane protein YeaQ/YmgE (transglycosylase-associated protein family)
MGVVSWILLGGLVGLLVSRLVPGRLPGGVGAFVLAGMAGGFLGGGGVTLVRGGDAAAVGLLELGVAVLGAALLVLIVGKAARVQPRTRA